MTAPPQLQQFASELEFEAARIRRLQRKMDRSRGATNPNNFNPNDTTKKGKKLRTYATVTRER